MFNSYFNKFYGYIVILLHSKKSLSILTAFILIAALALRLVNFSGRGFEYDEIWSMTMYSNMSLSKTLSTLSVPNNHPLHTILVNFMLDIFSEPWTIRIPALFFGVMTIPLLGLTAYRLFRSYYISILAMLLLSFNAASIHYSQTARGYSMQGFMILLFIFISISYIKNTSGRLYVIIYSICSFFIGVISVLIIPTSVLFLFPVCCCHLCKILIDSKYKQTSFLKGIISNIYIIISYCLLGGFILIWFITNMSQLQEAQGFGYNITSVSMFFEFAFATYHKLCPMWLLLMVIPLLFIRKENDRLILLSGAGIILFPLLASLIFKAGPPRVYFPLIPVLCLGASAGMSYTYFLSRKIPYALRNYAYFIIIIMMMMIYCWQEFAIFKVWTPPDWRHIYNQYVREVPATTYFVYTPTSSYPASYNNKPGIYKDNFLRTSAIKDGNLLIVFEDLNQISGMDKTGTVKHLNMKTSLIDNKFIAKTNFRIKKLPDNPEDGNSYFVLAVIKPVDKKVADTARNFLLQERTESWLLLNCWLNAPLKANEQYKQYYNLVARVNAQSLKELKLIQQRSNNIFNFYQISSLAGESH